jgi:hypothetical protein
MHNPPGVVWTAEWLVAEQERRTQQNIKEFIKADQACLVDMLQDSVL